MSERFKYKGDFKSILKNYEGISIVRWNRLEGRPRTFNFERALKAEVRDPLWMISRQWQTGEFIADDAGSPIETRVTYSETPIEHDEGQLDSSSDNIPLETLIEHLPLNFHQDGKVMSLDIRLLAGRQWLKMLKNENSVNSLRNRFIEQYPLRKIDTDREEDGYIAAHFEELQYFNAVAGRVMDGVSFYFFTTMATNRDNIWENLEIDTQQKIVLNGLLDNYINWFERLFYKPTSKNKNWNVSRLEYEYTGHIGTEKLAADEYYHGQTDWYNFNLTSSSEDSPTQKVNKSFVPTQVMFEGMPNKRWWEFEDSLTNFGAIEPDKTDISKLLLVSFGLMYTNDWFLLPLQAKVGNYVEIDSLTVRNVFNEEILIKKSTSDDWNIFGLETVTGNVSETANGILLQKSASIIQDGEKTESVNFIRDEMSNMVWGIESIVPLASGISKPGDEVAERTLSYLKQCYENNCNKGLFIEDDLEFAEDTNIFWQMISSTPENWIPFIPVRLPGSTTEIQLQRARMPRIISKKSSTFGNIEPKTGILRVGLDDNNSEQSSYFIIEEEIPKSGVIVSKSYRRTRDSNGRVYVWSGIQKIVGRGQGASGLVFDQIRSIES